MKNLKSLLFIVPAVVLAALTAIGMVTNVPSIEAVVWPEEPDLSEYEISKDSENSKLDTENLSDSKDKKTSKKKSNKKGSFKDGTYTGKGTGYGGITEVEVTVKNGSITKIDVLSNHDDAAFFNRALSLIDTIIEEQSYDVDTVSGATYSSRGILEAVKNALTGSNTLSATPTVTTPAPISTDGYDDSAVLTDGTYTGWHQGYGGLIYVSVTVKDGKMTAIDVTDHSGETDSYYNSAKSIISSMLAAGSPNVDTVSGATYSSNGIREAVKMALKSAANPDSSPEPTPEPTEAPTPKPTTKPKTDGTPADGTYTGTATCDKFNYTVSIDVTFKNGKCTKLSNFKLLNNSDSSNVSYADNAWNGMKASLKSNGTADTVSGATYSSDAIQEAFNNAYNEAVAKNGGTTPTPKPKATATPKPTVKPTTKPKTDGTPADGTFNGTAYCSEFDYTVSFDATFKNGKCTGLSNFKLLNNSDSSNVTYANNAWNGMKSALISKGTADTVTGATYSSDAIQEAFNNAYNEAVAKNGGTTPTPKPTATPTPKPTATPKPEEGSYSYTGTATVEKWNYEIAVTATFKDGKLTGITYDEPNTTSANKKYMTNAWNGLSAAITGGNTEVDAVSKATLSSNAIVSAYNSALEQAKKEHSDITASSVSIKKASPTATPKPTSTPSPTATPTPTATPKPSEDSYTYEGTAEVKGFGYNVTVKASYKNGALSDITMTTDNDDEDNDEYLYDAWDSISPSIKNGSTAVDSVSGATYSSKAIVNAYNNALEKAKKDHSDLNLESVTINGKGQTPTPKPTATPTPTSTPTPTPEPTATPTPTPVPERTYTVTSTCVWDEDLCYDDDWDNYDLTFNVKFSGDKLKDISISSSTDTSNSNYYNFAMSSIKSSLISSQSGDSVDVYCGATCSAKAIIDAYNQAKALNDAEN